MRLIFRLFLLLLLFLFLIRPLLRSLFAGIQSVSKPSPEVPPGGDLKKDPVCGTYVSAATSLNQKVAGELIYFCSPECREKYRARPVPH
jgi:YHS domain-containing protein